MASLRHLLRWIALPSRETPRTGHAALRAIMADPAMGAEARALSLEALVAMPPELAPAIAPKRRHYDIRVPDVSPAVKARVDEAIDARRAEQRAEAQQLADTQERERRHLAIADVAWRESVLSADSGGTRDARTPKLRRDAVARRRLWEPPKAVPDDNVVDLDAEREARRAPPEETPEAPPSIDQAAPSTPAQAAPMEAPAAAPETAEAPPRPRPTRARGAAPKRSRNGKTAAPTKLTRAEVDELARNWLLKRLAGVASPGVMSETLHKEWHKETKYSGRTLQRGAQQLGMVYTQIGLRRAWSLPRSS